MKIRLHNSPVICNAGPGDTVLVACLRAGVMLSAPCGGQQRCGKCRVRLLEGQVAGDTPDAEGRVRACAAIPLTDITIAPPADSELAVYDAAVPAAKSRPSPSPAVIGAAAVAIDIGTTTVSARLLDLDSDAVLDTVSALNDQRAFGADVMSRIHAAQQGKTGELFAAINRQTERIIKQFMARWNIERIEKLAVSGNTVMLHLFLNVDPSGMGASPFTPVFLEGKELQGTAIALSAEQVTILPSIAAFIGADITAALAALDIVTAKGPSLLIDIGTNGEMALYNRGSILCCSTAAGPAFEGAEISCGIGGVKGAISGIEIAGDSLAITTIGNAPPEGICGSGLIDAVALMLKRGIIDETGAMCAAEKNFSIAPNVSITAGDVRKFQLAKSAIFTGIRLLCKNAGLYTTDIQSIYIAGGFGFFINKYNAAAAGIFPEEFIDSLSICGNLSLQGAQECLSNDTFMEKCQKIIRQCSLLDLAADPAFTEEYTCNLLFNNSQK